MFHSTIFLLILSLLSITSSKQLNNDNDPESWNSFKTKHNKKYSNSCEEARRYEIFSFSKYQVERLNLEEANETGFSLTLNHLSDWTESELEQLHGYRGDLDLEDTTTSPHDNTDASGLSKLLDSLGSGSISGDLPDTVDWTKVPGRVSRVKDQGHCNSSWAFATTGVLEARMASMIEKKMLNKTSEMVELSEQNLIDCSTGSNHGCAGGTAFQALKDIEKMGGIDSEGFYPYEAKKGPCRFDKSRIVFNVKGAIQLASGDENKLKEVVARLGPVAASIDGSSFRFRHYNAGIYYNRNCKTERKDLNLAVLIVGYSSDPVYGDYWIVKNSWSEKWGEKGFIRMARNRNNHCGIATAALIPA